MGRLTLNVLLSFAQFEREVTGERIRDKIAMSKKKGKWMGGFPPLGYDCIERKLVIKRGEAKELNFIFEKYIELKSARKLKEQLNELGVVSKIRKFKSGREIGGKPYSEGNLYRLLQSKLYIGKITHHENVYKGEHKGIIKPELFEKAQNVIAENRRRKLGSENAKNPSILGGLVFDDCGNSMSAKHSNTRKQMYRYYTSQAIIQGYHHKAGSLPNIPAEQLERLVKNEITKFLKNKNKLQKHLENLQLEHQIKIIEIAKIFMSSDELQARLLMRYAIHRIEVSDSYVKIQICRDRLIDVLQNNIKKKKRVEKPENIIHLEKEIELSATNNGTKVIVGNVDSGRNQTLIKAIARAFYWNDQLVKGERKSFTEIATYEKISSPTYIAKIVRLRFLSPEIIEMILDGTHPLFWTVEKLSAIKETIWTQQYKQLMLS